MGGDETMTTLRELISSGYEGEAFPVLEDHMYGDEVVTVGNGEWADEEVYAFLKPRDAARHVIDLVEHGNLDEVLRSSDEMQAATLTVCPMLLGRVSESFDDFLSVSLDRDDGLQVDLSLEAEVMLGGELKEALKGLEGASRGHGRKI